MWCVLMEVSLYAYWDEILVNHLVTMYFVHKMSLYLAGSAECRKRGSDDARKPFGYRAGLLSSETVHNHNAKQHL